MLNWLKTRIENFVEDLEETSEGCPEWIQHLQRFFLIRPPNIIRQSGFRFFDLVLLHFEDYGYFARIYGNGRLIVVFPSRWTRLVGNRSTSVIFEIGKAKRHNNTVVLDESSINANADSVWVNIYKSEEHAHCQLHICQLTDLDCLDKMLNEVREAYA